MPRRTILALTLAASVIVPSVAQAQTLVFVVRHAERVDDPVHDQENPALSRAGEARAAKLRDMLGDAGIRGIYVSQYRRTQDTAAPLASKVKVKPELVPATATALIANMRAAHANDRVLIVGHTSTIPAIVKALTGSALEIAESDYGNLLIIVPATRTLTKLRF